MFPRNVFNKIITVNFQNSRGNIFASIIFYVLRKTLLNIY
jgi:hypothetical protein